MFPKINGRLFLSTGNISLRSDRRNYYFVRPKPPKIKEKHQISRGIPLSVAKKKVVVNKSTLDNNINNFKNNPIVEPELSKVITFSSRSGHSQVYKSDVQKSASQNLEIIDVDETFEYKLLLCTDIYDFSDDNEDKAGKDTKTRILCEIVQFFEQNNKSKTLSVETQESILKMIRANIFRPTPIISMPPMLLDFNTVFVEPSWPQLFYVYQILNRLISLYPSSPLFNLTFVKEVVYMMNIPDNNERLQLLAVLRIYFDTHKEQLMDILNIVQMKLFDIRDMKSPPFCVTPLLVFLLHIYQWMDKSKHFEFNLLVEKGVFPLILSSFLPLFQTHMISLLKAVFVPGSYLVTSFYNMLVSYWPKSSSQKQNSFTDFLIFTMAKMDETQASNNIRKSLKILDQMIKGDCIQASETALDFVVKAENEQWVMKHSKRFVLYLYDSVKKATTNSWSDIIRDKATEALIKLGKMDRKAFLKARQQSNTDQNKREREKNNDAFKGWHFIIESIEPDVIDTKKEIKKAKDEFKLIN